MNKQELVKAIAEGAELTQKDVRVMVDAYTSVIAEAVSNGEEVMVQGFGKFYPVEKEARTARNPKTGEAVEVPAKTVVRFKAGKDLKEAVK